MMYLEKNGYRPKPSTLHTPAKTGRSSMPHLSTDPLPMISLRGMTKAFSGMLANDCIDLDIFASEVHALLGENGAGKSTLMKLLFGFYRADAGDILMNGKPVSIQSPRDASIAKIGMVFQDLNLIQAFTVAENIALFLPDLQQVMKPEEIDRRILEISKQYGLEVNPQALVSRLSIGEQQKVEILKLLPDGEAGNKSLRINFQPILSGYFQDAPVYFLRLHHLLQIR